MAEEAIPQEALAAPAAEATLPARPDAGEAEKKDPAASKGPGHDGATGEHANAVATSEANAPPPVIDCTIAPFPSALLLYSRANGYSLAFS
jgi:hypothetical protein